MTEFNDITIVGIDTDRSQKTLDADTRRMRVHYELSEKPPSDWVRIFMATHGRSNLFRTFRATISGKYIVQEMGTDEISQAVAPEYGPLLDEDVAATNREYRQHLENLAQNAAAQTAKEQREQKTARQMLDSMKRNEDDSVN